MSPNNISCEVSTCMFNSAQACTLDEVEIAVTNSNPTNTVDTECKSFKI